MSSTYGGIDTAAVAALVAPALIADTTPLPEKVGGSAGPTTKASGFEHQHARLTSAGYSVTDANGLAMYMSDTLYDNMPCPVFCAMGVAGVSYDVVSWVMGGPGNTKYAGVNFRATKRTTLTQLANTVVALVSVVTGVTTTNTDAPVPNVNTSVILLKQSKV